MVTVFYKFAIGFMTALRYKTDPLNKTIGSTLVFGSKGPWFKSRWGRKNYLFSFLSFDLMIAAHLKINS